MYIQPTQTMDTEEVWFDASSNDDPSVDSSPVGDFHGITVTPSQSDDIWFDASLDASSGYESGEMTSVTEIKPTPTPNPNCLVQFNSWELRDKYLSHCFRNSGLTAIDQPILLSRTYGDTLICMEPQMEPQGGCREFQNFLGNYFDFRAYCLALPGNHMVTVNNFKELPFARIDETTGGFFYSSENDCLDNVELYRSKNCSCTKATSLIQQELTEFYAECEQKYNKMLKDMTPPPPPTPTYPNVGLGIASTVGAIASLATPLVTALTSAVVSPTANNDDSVFNSYTYGTLGGLAGVAILVSASVAGACLSSYCRLTRDKKKISPADKLEFKPTPLIFENPAMMDTSFSTVY